MSNSKRKLPKSSEYSSTCIIENSKIPTIVKKNQNIYRKKPAIFQDKMQKRVKGQKMDILLEIQRNPQPLWNSYNSQFAASKSLFIQTFESEPSFQKYKETVDFAFRNERSERQHDFLGRGKKNFRSKPRFADVFRTSEISNDSPRPPDPYLPTYEIIKQRQGQWDQKYAAPVFKTRKWRALLEPEKMRLVQTTLKNPYAKSDLPGALCEAPDFEKLNPGRWINDNAVNFYGVMLNLRSLDNEKSILNSSAPTGPAQSDFLRAHCFTSFFMSKYNSSGFDGVKRWTKKVDLFQKDIVIFPVNIQNMHWTCAAINIRQRRFEFYDSMGNENVYVLESLRDYIENEHLSKRKTELDTSDWEFCHPNTILDRKLIDFQTVNHDRID